MMKKGKKRINQLVPSLLAVAMLTACTSAPSGSEQAKPSDATKPSEAAKDVNPTGFPIVNQPITIKMMASKNSLHAEWKDMKVLQEYAKKTNINIDWITAPDSGFIEKRNISLASGDVPDGFYRGRLTGFDMVNYGTQGILIPLNSLIDQYAPNLKALLAKYPDVKKASTAPDGNIYALPQIIEHLSPRLPNKMWINKKWLDKLGLPLPTTMEEYYNTLKAFKEKDPNGNGKADEIPWSSSKTFTLINGIRGAWGIGTAGDKNANIDVGPDGKLRFYAMDTRYKELMEFMARMYKDGLIDKEVFTQDEPQLFAKGFEGLLGSATQINIGFVMGPKYSDDYIGLKSLSGPHGDKTIGSVNPMIQSTGTFAITSKNKHPEAMMRWVDFFYTEEGAKFLRMGIEGETYTTLPDGSVQYTDLITKNPNGLSLDQAIGQYTTWPGGGVPLFITEKIDKSGNQSPSAVAAAKLMEPDITKTVLPEFLFTKDEQDNLNALANDVNTYVNEMRVKFITGASPISQWDTYVSTLNKMGVDKLLAIYQAAYDRYKKS
jgi:putative aldouronate transport system substrate-binding protein